VLPYLAELQTTGLLEGTDPVVLNGLLYKCVLKSDNALFRLAGWSIRED